MPFEWPQRVSRIPTEEWTTLPVESLALKYDNVENHGWYKNLEPTIEQLSNYLKDGHIIIDYSGGTGILTSKLLQRIPNWQGGILIADSSPKFLRLALDKHCFENRVAFRLIRYLKDKKRLEFIDELLGKEFLERGFDGLVSTNAIHLYYDLIETLKSWAHVLRKGANIFIQSGNIRNTNAIANEWVIDETVDAINNAAINIVRNDKKYERYHAILDDSKTMSAHIALRQKYFLPIRELDYYLDALKQTGFFILDVSKNTIEARVSEWYQFLKVYHEGVLGWIGGSEKVDGIAPTKESVKDRLDILKSAMAIVFEGKEHFDCCWTYITCQK